MTELLSGMRSDERMGLLCMAMMLVTGLAVWLSLQWRWHRRTEMEAALKQDMLNRGMTADEIARVLAAPLGADAAAPLDSTRSVR